MRGPPTPNLSDCPGRKHGLPRRPAMIVRFSSETLVLRAPHAEDIDAIAILADNPAIATMLSRMPHPYTAPTPRPLCRRRPNARMAIASMPSPKPRVAVSSVASPGNPGRRQSAELGYWIGEPFWGRGIATEAAHAVIAMAFRTRDIDYIDARCRVTNPASRRVLQKSGFQFQGTEMVEVLALGLPCRWNGSGSTARPGSR
jgi:RimJ/RimL family protein N-acetyltransferase